MRAPTYKGPKKNHASVWLGEPVYYKDDIYKHRIRVIYSREIEAQYFYSEEEPCRFCYGTPNEEGLAIKGSMFVPCWYSHGESVSKNIANMKKYDEEFGRRTIFLGYVKDNE